MSSTPPSPTTPTPIPTPVRSMSTPIPRPPSAGKVKGRGHGRFASVSALPTLRAMYQRAARAFLQRNTTETQYLIDAAFRIITPPQTPLPDHLSSQRKKWDILRITLETTLYTSPPAATPQPPTTKGTSLTTTQDRCASPSLSNNLRSNLLLSPPSLLATLHTRSLQLFTPPDEKPSSAFLPSQILVSLVLASLKLDCAHVGRGMVEDWLARRPPPPDPETPSPSPTSSPKIDEGYAKVVDVYCLHVLPRLGEWEFAKDFLSYEIELPVERRSQIIDTLNRLHAQSQIPASPPPPYRTKPLYTSSSSSEELSGSRPHSPSSATSSNSASTYTAIPATPRPGAGAKGKGKGKLGGLAELEGGLETRSPSRASTVKPTSGRKQPVPTATTTNMYDAVRSTPTSQPLVPAKPTTPPTSSSSLIQAQWSLIKKHVHAHLPFLIFVLLPALGFILGLRRRARAKGKQSAEELRRRLVVGGGGGAEDVSVLVRIVRAVRDVVVMAGRGIV